MTTIELLVTLLLFLPLVIMLWSIALMVYAMMLDDWRRYWRNKKL